MRVTLFTEVFLPKVDGVVTRVTRTVEQLTALGHEVQVVAPGTPPREFAGARVVRVPSLPLWPVYPELSFGLPTPAPLAAVHRFDPDVVHAVNPVWTAAAGVLYARATGRPLLASYHTNVPDYTAALGIGFARRPAEWVIRALHNRAQVNLCTSAPMVEQARESGIERVDLWPKAVDTVTFTPAAAEPAVRARLTDGHPEAPLVAYVGRMSREKSLDRLPGVMAELCRRVPGARLAMVGDGPHLERLRAGFDPDSTVFTGYLAGADLAAAYAAADVFVFPSTTETLGLVALEAMASGVPVVGARAGGIPFVVDDRATGRLVDPEAGDARWAEVIAGLLDDAASRERLARAARAEAGRHSWRAATGRLVGFYRLAARRRGSS
ncbi:glycosyltransferase family 1 protein [Corynebacterium frankenforstense]|uniref:glycosyltransferase family 4 protein n=1 Tax=Corynebacterium frankenforstense TaxID=1230998 RepID=UPI0026F2D10E|nr:glycosyltransferase family 1 protein [Corynebacterium frankenforstense]